MTSAHGAMMEESVVLLYISCTSVLIVFVYTLSVVTYHARYFPRISSQNTQDCS